MVPAQFCQQAMPLLEQAKTLDTPKYRAYAAAQAAADTKTVKCAK
jgi:3-keto-L-gulonate-6-phosphate decarboxylase